MYPEFFYGEGTKYILCISTKLSLGEGPPQLTIGFSDRKDKQMYYVAILGHSYHIAHSLKASSYSAKGEPTP